MRGQIRTTKTYQDRGVWGAFLRCGTRIRDLSCSTQGVFTKAEAQLIQLLLSQNKKRTFLPSLQSMEWNENVDTAGILKQLAPRTLSKLKLAIASGTPDDQVAKLFEALGAGLPSLTALELNSERSNIRVDWLLTARFHLRYLAIGQDIVLSSSEFRAAVTLPGLESLHATIATFSNKEDPMENQTLQELKVRTLRSATGLVDLFPHLGDFPNCRALSLEVANLRFACMSTIFALISALAKSPIVSSLRSLGLLVSTAWRSAPPSPNLGTTGLAVHPNTPGAPNVIAGDTLTSLLYPLFPYARLDKLELDVDAPITVSDEDVHNLAIAWPTLERLALTLHSPNRGSAGGGGSSATATTQLTPLALAHLARLCPRLAHLSIDDATARSWPLPRPGALGLPDDAAMNPDGLPPTGASPHPLRVLQPRALLPRERADRIALARFVDALFPALDADACAADAAAREARGERTVVVSEGDAHTRRSAYRVSCMSESEKMWREVWNEVRELQRKRARALAPAYVKIERSDCEKFSRSMPGGWRGVDPC